MWKKKKESKEGNTFRGFLRIENPLDITDSQKVGMSKHKAIPKKIRLYLYDKYNHKCAYCGCDLAYKDMQIDHIKSVYANADIHQTMTDEEMYAIDNLLPACRQCNFYKSSMDIETFRKSLINTLMNNLRKSFQYRLALKYGLIEEHIEPVKFYFETLHEKNDDQ